MRHHAARRRHDLQLRRAFIDVHDARIAVQAFDFMLEHVAFAAMALDRVIGDGVGHFRREEFGHWRQQRGQFGIDFYLFLRVRVIAIRIGFHLVAITQIDALARFIQQGTPRKYLRIHAFQHVADRRDVAQQLAELRTI